MEEADPDDRRDEYDEEEISRKPGAIGAIPVDHKKGADDAQRIRDHQSRGYPPKTGERRG
jgi:hypothetical protein